MSHPENSGIPDWWDHTKPGAEPQAEGEVVKWDGRVATARCPAVAVGTLVQITVEDSPRLAEVVSVDGDTALLMPYDDMRWLGLGARVRVLHRRVAVRVGRGLLGRVLDGLGRPLDGLGPVEGEAVYPVHADPPQAMKRKRITQPLPLGVRAIDGLLTVGKGQRIGLFAGSGVGKSSVLGMVARNSAADVNVIALSGGSGREVKDFLERDLGEEGLSRSVVVVATSGMPSLQRAKGPLVAMAIAEYFRDQGLDALYTLDSLTHLAIAQRDIGLARGEPPVLKGYTPSVYGVLPPLLERASASAAGTITALISVLIEGDDLHEPIADLARGILDGHLVLSRRLAQRNHHPALDVLSSVSRVMPEVTTDEHRACAGALRESLAAYTENEDLINTGAYKRGTNPQIDAAIDRQAGIVDFLRQGVREQAPYDGTLDRLRRLLR